MAARVLIGGRWRRVSDAEAKYRRAKGQRVIDDREPEPPVPAAPAVADSAPVPTGAAVLDAIVGAALAPTAEPLAINETATDLTDEELERLTAPES